MATRAGTARTRHRFEAQTHPDIQAVPMLLLGAAPVASASALMVPGAAALGTTGQSPDKGRQPQFFQSRHSIAWDSPNIPLSKAALVTAVPPWKPSCGERGSHGTTGALLGAAGRGGSGRSGPRALDAWQRSPRLPRAAGPEAERAGCPPPSPAHHPTAAGHAAARRPPAVGAQENAACTPLPQPSGQALQAASDNGITNPALLNTLVKVRLPRGSRRQPAAAAWRPRSCAHGRHACIPGSFPLPFFPCSPWNCTASNCKAGGG